MISINGDDKDNGSGDDYDDGDDKDWWKLSELTTKWSKNENPERIPLNPGIKNIGKSRPEISRDPEIWQNPVPKNPGIEILDPARACSEPM